VLKTYQRPCITLPLEVYVAVVYQAESLGNFPDVSRPLCGLVFKRLILFGILQRLSQSWRRFAFKPLKLTRQNIA